MSHPQCAVGRHRALYPAHRRGGRLLRAAAQPPTSLPLPLRIYRHHNPHLYASRRGHVTAVISRRQDGGRLRALSSLQRLRSLFKALQSWKEDGTTLATELVLEFV